MNYLKYIISNYTFIIFSCCFCRCSCSKIKENNGLNVNKHENIKSPLSIPLTYEQKIEALTKLKDKYTDENGVFQLHKRTFKELNEILDLENFLCNDIPKCGLSEAVDQLEVGYNWRDQFTTGEGIKKMLHHIKNVDISQLGTRFTQDMINKAINLFETGIYKNGFCYGEEMLYILAIVRDNMDYLNACKKQLLVRWVNQDNISEDEIKIVLGFLETILSLQGHDADIFPDKANIAAISYWDEYISDENKDIICKTFPGKDIDKNKTFANQTNMAKKAIIKHYSNNNPPLDIVSFDTNNSIFGVGLGTFADLNLYSIDEKNKRYFTQYINPDFLQNLTKQNSVVQFVYNLNDHNIGHVVSIFNYNDGKKYFIDSNYAIGPLSFETEDELFSLLKISEKCVIESIKQHNPNMTGPFDSKFSLKIKEYRPDLNESTEQKENFKNLRNNIRSHLNITD